MAQHVGHLAKFFLALLDRIPPDLLLPLCKLALENGEGTLSENDVITIVPSVAGGR